MNPSTPIGNPTATLNNPLNVWTIPEFLAAILYGVQLILAPIIVLMIIYSGFMFLTAQGSSEKLTKAKKALLFAMIGAGIILGARLLSVVVVDTISNLNNTVTVP